MSTKVRNFKHTNAGCQGQYEIGKRVVFGEAPPTTPFNLLDYNFMTRNSLIVAYVQHINTTL